MLTDYLLFTSLLNDIVVVVLAELVTVAEAVAVIVKEEEYKHVHR